MRLTLLKVWVALTLGVAGALLCAASWQRWAGSCTTAQECALRQDHLYDFLPPTDPWAQAGSAALLGGLSLLVFALAFPLLPWALTSRRPGPVSATALIASEFALVAVAGAVLRSGLAGEVVSPVLGVISVTVWLIGPPVLLVGFAASAPGWARASSILLILAMPLVATFYAIGSYDTQPWWEAIAGSFMVAGALCLLVCAGRPVDAVQRAPVAREPAATGAPPD